ncbi:MAG: hypothetical protein H5T63_02125, partial [Chloroflexi bacterium]|nr:hypothetical protein [Chloroflexota bacterium]
TNADGVGTAITFDPALLRVVSVVSDISAFPKVLRNICDNEAGTVLYDAGAPLECHMQGNCPSGVQRIAAITFYPVAPSSQATYIRLYGQVTWNGEYTFDGEGSGTTVTILPPSFVHYLPLIMHGYR